MRTRAVLSVVADQFKSEFANKHLNQGRAEGRAEGQAEGRAESIIDFLETRGIKVPEADRARITTCQDIDQLTVWVRRAATVTSVDELFA